MPKVYSRTQRVGDMIQREVAQLIQCDIKDPRVGMVTVLAVDVSRDLSHAKVYISTLGEEAEGHEVVKVLNHAAGFLRCQLANNVKLRITPQLHFIYDNSITRGRKLTDLIDLALDSDKKNSHGAGE